MTEFNLRWSSTERIRESIIRSKNHLPSAVGHQLDALLTAESLAILAGTLTVWAGSHFFGVGEIVDVGLLLVGAFFVGWSITDVARDLLDFALKSVNARSDADIDRAAQSLARAIITGGLTAVMALLLKRSATSVQNTRGASVGAAARPRQPGLLSVGTDSQAGKLVRRPTVTGDPTLPAGEGVTTAFGDVTYSTAGSATAQQLVRVHELVHSFLSPRLGIFRTFRARLAMSAYSRSVILTYLEEALAESIAQTSTFGLVGLLRGIRFPIANGYVTLSQLACEGAEIGTIVVGTQRFSVQLVAKGR